MKTHLSTAITFTLIALPQTLPFVTFLAFGNTGFELVKVYLFVIITIAILSTAIYFNFIKLQKLKLYLKSPPILLLFMWIAWNFVVSIFNNNLPSAFWGDPWYAFGLLELGILAIYLLLIVEFQIQIDLKLILIGFGLLGFIQAYFINLSAPLFLNQRFSTTLGEPNWLGSFLMSAFICTLVLARQIKKKPLNYRLTILTAAAICIGILATGSRSAILGSLAALFIFWFSSLKFIRPKYVFSLTIGILLLGNLSVFAIGFKAKNIQQQSIITNLSWMRGLEGTDSRFWIYEKGLALFRQKPLTGWGWEQIAFAYKQPAQSSYFGLENLNLPRSHNFILDLLITGGLVSACLFSAFLLLVLKLGIQLSQKHSGLLAAYLVIFAILIYGMFNPISISLWVILFFFCGLILATSFATKHKQ